MYLPFLFMLMIIMQLLLATPSPKVAALVPLFHHPKSHQPLKIDYPASINAPNPWWGHREQSRVDLF